MVPKFANDLIAGHEAILAGRSAGVRIYGRFQQPHVARLVNHRLDCLKHLGTSCWQLNTGRLPDHRCAEFADFPVSTLRRSSFGFFPHSTGPRTAEGKVCSSRNNLRHGFTGQITLLPDEDREAHDAVRQGLRVGRFRV